MMTGPEGPGAQDLRVLQRRSETEIVIDLQRAMQCAPHVRAPRSHLLQALVSVFTCGDLSCWTESSCAVREQGAREEIYLCTPCICVDVAWE